MKGIIFDIQYGSMYDGPGLRTCVFFKGCPLRCRWCQNPESHFPGLQLSYITELCISCGQCAKACPGNAMKLKNNMPYCDDKMCTLCGRCAGACPREAMELIGLKISAPELLLKLRRDRPFYESSGGGVTFTGGEPTMQEKFLFKALEIVRRDGISAALETCGYFRTEIIDELLELTDLFLFDIKHINAERHREYTGFTNEMIKKNFKLILKKAGPEKITPRIPLIPGFNTDSDSAHGIARFIKGAGYSGEVHLMPYNPMSRTKWLKIGRGSEYRNFGELTEGEIEKITGIFEKSGFPVVCNR